MRLAWHVIKRACDVNNLTEKELNMNATTSNSDLLNQEQMTAEVPPARVVSNGKSELTQEDKPKNNLRFRLVLAAVGVVAMTALTYGYEKFVAPYESTDDAFIEGDATPIAPQVAGQVVQLLVNDNEEVKQGQLLVQIDPREYQAKADQTKASLDAAKGRLDQAKAQNVVDEAKVAQEQANVIAAEAQSKYAAADSKRYQAVGSLAVSESQLDLANTQAKSTAAQVDAARSQEVSAEAQVKLDTANIETAKAEVETDEAANRQAE